MKPPSIRKLLYFAKAGSDVLAPAEAARRWGFQPEGANFYYGLNAAAADHLRKQGRALRDNHVRFFELAAGALRARGSFLVNLGLWPFEPGAPYVWVEQRPDLVRAVARELHARQEMHAREGKRLDIVLRYASEMNDPLKPSQPWGRPHGPWDPAHARPFRDTFRRVRQIFREEAPDVRFTFSPAIRCDITGERYSLIADFWPGREWVDCVSCTWYAGRRTHVEGAAAALERYLTDMREHRLPFALDEVGGIDGDRDNDGVLAEMLGALDRLPGGGFEYVTLFLHGKWATDATPAFLTRGPGSAPRPQPAERR